MPPRVDNAAQEDNHEQGRPAVDLDALLLPYQLGPYVLFREIGHGGFGAVYLGENIRNGTDCVIKVLAPRHRTKPTVLERFALEISIGSSIKHPNIMPVLDSDQHCESPYFVMPHLGRDLRHSPEFRSTDPALAVSLLRSISGAVHELHQHNFLHRDIKPDNVVIHDKSRVPYIVDFGLAKNVEATQALSTVSETIGTPPYMPPEQLDPKLGGLGAAADIYGLGATLYELLTQCAPFPNPKRGNRDIETQIKWDEPRRPSSLREGPQLHRDLDRICLICLQKFPHDRYASAAALADDLHRFEQGLPIRGRLPGPVKRMWRACQRHMPLTIIAAVAILCAVMGGFASHYYASEAAQVGIELGGARTEAASAKEAASAAKAAEAAAKLSERTQSYVSDMRDANFLWQHNDLDTLTKIVNKYEISDNQDLRNLEWFFWRRRIGTRVQRIPLNFTPDIVELSREGNRLAVVGGGEVEVIDLPIAVSQFRGRMTSNVVGSTETMACAVSLSPGSKLVAATCRAGKGKRRLGYVKVWDLQSHKELLSTEDPDISGESIAFSPDGRSVVAAGIDAAWYAWDAVEGGRHRSRGVRDSDRYNPPQYPFIGGTSDTVFPCRLRFVDPVTLVLAMDSSSQVWHWPISNEAGPVVGEGHVVGGMPLLVDGHTCVFSCAIGAAPIKIGALREFARRSTRVDDSSQNWSVSKIKLSEESREMIPMGATIMTTPFTFNILTLDSSRIAVHCTDGVIRVWTLDSRARAIGMPNEMHGAPDGCRSIAVSQRTLAAAGGQQVAVWRLGTDESVGASVALDSSDLGLWGLASSTGNIVATPRFATHRTMLEIRRASEQVPFSSIDIGLGTPQACVFSEDGRFLVVRVLNTAVTPRMVKEDREHPPRIEVWELAGPRLLASFALASGVSNGPSGSLPNTIKDCDFAAFQVNDPWVYIAVDERVHRVRLTDGRAEEVPTKFAVGSVTLSPSQRYLAATGSECGVFDLVEQRWVWTKPIPSLQAVFHRLDKYVLVQSANKATGIVAFECQNGSTRPPIFRDESASDLLFSSDKTRLFSVSPERLRVYSVDENPGTLLLETSDLVVLGDRTLDRPFVRSIERQLGGR